MNHYIYSLAVIVCAINATIGQICGPNDDFQCGTVGCCSNCVSNTSCNAVCCTWNVGGATCIWLGDDPDCTLEPTAEPTTPNPTPNPTPQPTPPPTPAPTMDPTADPTGDPTSDPTEDPTSDPTTDPTRDPTSDPTSDPTNKPTPEPIVRPTVSPSPSPTRKPSESPTPSPTPEPTTNRPTKSPSPSPTPKPSDSPTPSPTSEPTETPKPTRTPKPSPFPTPFPTSLPTPEPTAEPSPSPTPQPTPLPITVSPTIDCVDCEIFDVILYEINYNLTIGTCISDDGDDSKSKGKSSKAAKSKDKDKKSKNRRRRNLVGWGNWRNTPAPTKDYNSDDCIRNGGRIDKPRDCNNDGDKSKSSKSSKPSKKSKKAKKSKNSSKSSKRRRNLLWRTFDDDSDSGDNMNNDDSSDDDDSDDKIHVGDAIVLDQVCLTYVIQNIADKDCGELSEIFLPICVNNQTDFNVSSITEEELNAHILSIEPSEYYSAVAKEYDSLGILITIDPPTNARLNSFDLCLSNVSSKVRNRNYSLDLDETVEVSDTVELIIDDDRTTCDGDGLPCLNFKFPDPPCPTKVNCDCNGKMVDVTVIYVGSDGAATVSFYPKNADVPYSECTFTNVTYGDKITCSSLPDDERFETVTNFEIAYDNPSVTTCTGQFHTSCSKEILHTFGDPTDCNDLYVIGWNDFSGNKCWDNDNSYENRDNLIDNKNVFYESEHTVIVFYKQMDVVLKWSFIAIMVTCVGLIAISYSLCMKQQKKRMKEQAAMNSGLVGNPMMKTNKVVLSQKDTDDEDDDDVDRELRFDKEFLSTSMYVKTPQYDTDQEIANILRPPKLLDMDNVDMDHEFLSVSHFYVKTPQQYDLSDNELNIIPNGNNDIEMTENDEAETLNLKHKIFKLVLNDEHGKERDL